jgi:hypothetical protein
METVASKHITRLTASSRGNKTPSPEHPQPTTREGLHDIGQLEHHLLFFCTLIESRLEDNINASNKPCQGTKHQNDKQPLS